MSTFATSAVPKLTLRAKQLVGISMYAKGKAYVGAAIILRRQDASEPTQYVALHLVCQGVEVALKGLLLLRDYDYFIQRLRKPIGHDLVAVAKEASDAFGLSPLRLPLMSELRALSLLYSRHFLRYGSVHDIFVDPRGISHEKVLRRLAAAIRLAERELRSVSTAIVAAG